MDNEETRQTSAIVTGLGLVCIALFLGVSLYSHSPYDLMDYHAGRSLEIENKAGLLGAQLAHHAFCMYGLGAWIIATVMLVFGFVMCSTRSMSGLAIRLCGAVLLTAVVCAAAAGKSGGLGDSYPAGPGGLLGGTVLAPPLLNYFGPVCQFLVLGLASILACLLIAPFLTETILSLLGRWVASTAHSFADWALGRMHSGMVMPEPAMASGSAIGNNSSMRFKSMNAAETSVVAAPKPSERHDLIAAPESRKFRVPASDLPGPNSVRKPEVAEARDRRENVVLPPVPPPLPVRNVYVEDESKAEKRISKADAQAASEAEEAERRAQEALKQVEAAEAERLERERQSKEQYQKEAKALEKLEKLERERASQDREKIKQQEVFMAAMSDAAGSHGDAAPATVAATGDDSAEAAPPVPQVPVHYDLPKYDILIENDITPPITSDVLKARGMTVIQTLWDFKIGAKLAAIQSGPTVTMYELELEPGIKVQRVVSLQDNLAMAMKAENGVRIIAPIPGKSSIGIEIPNAEDHTVRMRPILESPQFRAKTWTLPLILGRDAVGNPLVGDLAKMPHLLIAGTTGSGKSVCVNSIILSIMILRKPHEVKLILVDPKQVEMTDFKGIPHLLSPVVTDMKLAAGVLTWAVQKMEQRYERMSHVGVRNIGTFNKMTKEERIARLPEGEAPEDYSEAMPYIVIIVDEFADLMMTSGKEIEQSIARLAQKARAAGIHVILATQRPSADVLTGLIKTNLPCRICFQVKSKIDSRIVLDQGGAEKLAGKGDMLYIGDGSSNLVRAKGVYITDDEIKGVVSFCKSQAEPVYSEEVERVAAQGTGEDDCDPETNRQALEIDEKFDEGVQVFLAQGRASTSLLQRRMGLGYTRAAKLCDQMQARGIVGPDRGAKGRELLITQDLWDQYKRTRANNNGSAFGPKGSKDNPGTPRASVTAEVIEDNPGTAPGEELNPALIAQLENVDGVKDRTDDEDDE